MSKVNYQNVCTLYVYTYRVGVRFDEIILFHMSANKVYIENM